MPALLPTPAERPPLVSLRPALTHATLTPTFRVASPVAPSHPAPCKGGNTPAQGNMPVHASVCEADKTGLSETPVI